MLWQVLNEVYPGDVAAMTRGSGEKQIHLLGPDKIFPVSWAEVPVPCLLGPLPPAYRAAHPEGGFDRDACVALFPGAYAISYWTHSWGAEEFTENSP